MDSLPELLAAVLAAIVSAVGVVLVRKNASSAGLLDIPNERSSHDTPVPRGGGIGIVVGIVLSASMLYLLGRLSLEMLLATMGGAALIGGVGFIDDRRDVSARTRIIVHFAAAAWALFWVSGIAALPVMPFEMLVVVGVHAIGIVWALNLYNFMDGIDGIALQEGLFISIAGVALLWDSGSPWIGILLCVAASCAVVLRWNWAPARIFLGDAGSGFLGFLLAVIAVATFDDVGPVPWMILWGVFLTDATVTLLMRMLTSQSWYSAHRSHAYQRLARRTESHAVVSGGALAINVVWLLPWAYLAHTAVFPPIVCLTVAFSPLVAGAVWVGAGRRETSH